MLNISTYFLLYSCVHYVLAVPRTGVYVYLNPDDVLYRLTHVAELLKRI